MSDQDFERKETARLDAMFDAQFADEPTQETDYADEPQVNGWPLYSGLPKTDKQSEALRLAEHMEISATHAAAVREKAAAELRRLHERETELAARLGETIPALEEAAAELDRLHELNAELVEALNNIIEEPKNTMSDNKALREIVRITKAALAKAEGKE